MVGAFEQVHVPHRLGDGTDIAIEQTFVDAGWGSGRKGITYEAAILAETSCGAGANWWTPLPSGLPLHSEPKGVTAAGAPSSTSSPLAPARGGYRRRGSFARTARPRPATPNTSRNQPIPLLNKSSLTNTSRIPTAAMRAYIAGCG